MNFRNLAFALLSCLLCTAASANQDEAPAKLLEDSVKAGERITVTEALSWLSPDTGTMEAVPGRSIRIVFTGMENNRLKGEKLNYQRTPVAIRISRIRAVTYSPSDGIYWLFEPDNQQRLVFTGAGPVASLAPDIRASVTSASLSFSSAPQDTSAEQTIPADLRYTAYWLGGLGGVEPEGDSGVSVHKGVAGFLQFGYKINERFDIALDLGASTMGYDIPDTSYTPCAGCTNPVTQQVDVFTWSAAVLCKGHTSYNRLAGHAGIGLGMFWSEATTSRGLYGEHYDNISKDSAVAPVILAGLSYRIADKNDLGIEYRYTDLKGNFGELSDGEISIGGASLMLTYAVFY